MLFTFQRMLDPNQAFRKAYPVSFPYFTDMGLDKLITKVEKVDPYTVKFTLAEPNAPFIQNMAMEFASILSAEYGDQLMKAGKAADINQKPVGTRSSSAATRRTRRSDSTAILITGRRAK